MSPRRPDLSYEEAAAAAGIDPNIEKMFDDPKNTTSVNDVNKTLLGRRVTLVIERNGEFDTLMTDTVRDVLIRYAAKVIAGGAGKHEKEAYFFSKQAFGGEELEPVTLTVTHETYELEEQHVDPNRT
jgi:hypothetical protein